MVFKQLILFLVLFISTWCSAAWYKQDKAIMGTRVTVELWAETKKEADTAINAVMNEMHRIDALMSPYKQQSELYFINENAAIKPVKVSDEFYQILDKSIEISQLTQGAFDITFASIGFLYDYRNKLKPSKTALDQKLKALDYKKIQLNINNKTVYFSHPDTKIDLGGIAKGYAVDNSLLLLRGLKIKHALVTAGGDTGLLGDRKGRPWIVGIQDPRNKQKQAVRLPLENEALSTSGDYERYFEADGIRYHHILQPTTGKSAAEVQSVTIVGPQSIMTDALSTSVFVLGTVKGLKLIDTLPDYDALIVDKNRKLHYSKALRAN